jgi:hypothetical protein
MPLKFISDAEVPKAKRKSKIESSADYQDLVKVLTQGLPTGKTVTVEFSPATLKLFKGDAERAAKAFVLRLRDEYGERYRIRLVGGHLYISTKEKKK